MITLSLAIVSITIIKLVLKPVEPTAPTIIPAEVIRATEEEKKYQISMLETLNKAHKDSKEADLGKLQSAALENENIFTQMMEVAKTCSLGQMTDSLFKVGGQYRRNM